VTGASDAPTLTPLQKAFLALEQTRAQLRAAQDGAREPIAIIGVGCRIPGDVNDAESFWRLLRDGIDATGPLPRDRWDVDALYHPDPDHAGTIATRAGGFLRSVDTFDPMFFGITRREAAGMDPQQRLFLETCWEALEHAGHAPDRLERSATGVYVGVCGSDYAYLQLDARDRTLLDAHFASGIAHSVASGRLSYLLGLQGPSLTIDTACSSSLVAVHLACQALRSGDCRMALAGGVNVILAPELYIALSQAHMLSPEGRCKTFDASADGFARGEGSAVVVLKRLRDAEADGDRILAVVRGTAVNQDGPSSGLTAPNGPAQESVIREALSRAGIAPRQVSYIEAHGTGTQLGDPLELRALGAVFADGRETPLYVGSLKTNVGHLEAAAGVAGLIKLVLSLEHREIPAHLHFTTPTPHIPWDELALRVPTKRVPWEAIDGRRIAGVSSFGFSGTNAHVVVEEAPQRIASTSDAPLRSDTRRHVFLLSATNEGALRAAAQRCADALSTDAAFGVERNLADLCYTAAIARAQHAQRAAVMAGSIGELADRLHALARGEEVEGVHVARVPNRDPARIAFLFTGQGAQYAGMGRELFEREPVFRGAIERAANALVGVLDRPLIQILYPANDAESVSLDETMYTQPALFAIEYALASLWDAWGVRPDVVIGHSVGEYAAAVVAGVMTLDDAARLIAERGRLMQSLPAGGAMAAIFASEPDVTASLDGHASSVAIAAVNAAGQTVISGAANAVDALCASFAARGIRCQRLTVSHAFHSPLVEPVLADFAAAASRARLSRPQLPLVSNVTGALADANMITKPDYWRNHIRATVRFADGMRAVAALKPDVCLEIGPHPALLSMAQEAFGERSPAFVPSLRRSTPAREQLDDALGALFLAGASIDWRAVWASSAATLTDLPTYPFQRERCWFRARRAPSSRGKETGHPLLGVRLHSALRDVVQFEQTLRAEDVPFFRDHVVRGRTILPGAAFVEMALAAARAIGAGEAGIHEMLIGEPLAVDADEVRRIQTIVRTANGGAQSFEILSTSMEDDEAPWRLHVQGAFVLDASSVADAPSFTMGVDVMHIDAGKHQEMLASRGLIFGPSLRGVRFIDARNGASRASISVDEIDPDLDRYVLPPALLDASLQALSAAIPQGAARDVAYLPLMIETVRVHRTPRSSVTAYADVAEPQTKPSDTLTGRVVIADERGVVAELTGITLRAASDSAESRKSDDLYTVDWAFVDDEAGNGVSLDALVADAGPLLTSLVREHRLDEYQEGFVRLEAITTRWIVQAFRALGWRDDVGSRVSANFSGVFGILPRYAQLTDRFFAILVEDGILEEVRDGFMVARSIEVGDPSADARALVALHPSSRARIELALRCGDVLAEILRGDVDPLERLFPNGSSELAIALYRDAPEAKAYNQLAREAVRAMVRQAPAGRTFRILEIGGGTGGTTSWVAPALDASRVEYLFTDVGGSLVAAARERFSGARPFMSFSTFDVERSPSAQGITGPFDLVIAANVIHATADLRHTLAHVDQLLAPGGALLMLEVAGFERWIDLTFGLTEGWWRFTDRDVRANYPLLSREQWRTLFASIGYEHAEVGVEQAISREVLLAARKPTPKGPAKRGQWIVLADEKGVGNALAHRLERDGHSATVIRRGTGGGWIDALTDVLNARSDIAGIAHLWSLDVAPIRERDASSLMPSQRENIETLLTLVQQLGRRSFDVNGAPRLWIATENAQPVGVPARLNLAQAPIWGLGQGIAREHPELAPARVDLDRSASVAEQADALFALLGRSSRDDQFAIRSGAAYVPRLTPYVSPSTVPASPGVVERLVHSAQGTLEDLTLVTTPRRAPLDGQVEIEIHAAGLNFRDVMNAVAMRADPEPLGGECAGRVVAVGEDVTGVTVGDAVIAIAEGCFATSAVTDVAQIALLPKGMSFAEAATIPFAFMTATFALIECARLQRGETVLIHAAAGGVGQAAVQIARANGATIIATAGSEAKRRFLSEQGIEHVLDSRSVAFADAVRSLTGGTGVDVVLNSLAGDFITAGVSCLADDGRFCEIGKRDIWSPEQFAEVRPRGRYFAIDLADLRQKDPARSAALFRAVVADVEAGAIAPLPVHAFGLRDASNAFRFMAQARHIGKIVLVPEETSRGSLERLVPDATYLVTGGLSGIGLLTAQRLVERGARHLVLAGRRAPSDAAQAKIAGMRAGGVDVRAPSVDVGDMEALRAMFAEIDASMPELRGVVHSAGALDDAALLQQSWNRFATPLHAKVDGAWGLHVLTSGRRLDFFTLYSSVASVFGSSGQANHSAANAFLDALAGHRRALGLPAISVSWGAWSEVGAAADRRVDARIGALGIGMMSPTRGLDLLDAVTRGDAAHVVAIPVTWARFLPTRDASSGRAFFDRVAAPERSVRSVPAIARTTSTTPASAGVIDREALADASSAQRSAMLIAFVGEHVAHVISAPSARSIAVDQPLNEIGLDSLMAVELRNRLARGLQLSKSLPATLVFDHPTLEALAQYLETVVVPLVVEAPPQSAVSTDSAATLDDLTEEQIEALFASRMGNR
jgi:acyl transferase domain-containing protein/NADPH:quinone reductase-like Zn-dependent oxidoreductase/SAM-dependent methyltransferase